MAIKIGVLLVGFSILVGEMARQFRVRRDEKLRKEPFGPGLTGAEFARELLAAKGIEDVEVKESRALFTDHYVPKSKTLRLSPQNYHGTNAAAVGMAGHEVGHAIQAARGHRPLQWRQTAIQLSYFGTFASLLLSLPVLIFSPRLGLLILGFCWGFIQLNNLMTLPVEFDASARTKDLIRNAHLLSLGKDYNRLEDMMRAAEVDKVSGLLRTWHYIFSWIFLWRKR